MKKILFILIITIASLNAKPCMTDIYYGNGVWNTRSQGEDGMWALRRFMQTKAITPLSIEDEKNKLYSFKHAYNPSKSTIDDLIETFWQLKESGQISDGYFFAIYSALAAESNGKEFLQKLQTIITTYNGDVNAMYQLYTNASFNQKHNVLLIAHSQGNLFGNKMYTLLNEDQKAKFRMVSVATPANSVAGSGPYTTASGDYVINPIPGALPSNVDGFGHTFIGTYLNGSINAPRQIALYVKNAYDNLMQTTACTEYQFTRVIMPTYGILHVYGNVEYGKDELVGTVTLAKSSAVWDDNEEAYRCPSEDSIYWAEGIYCCYNWTSYKDDKNNNWIPGQYITSRSYLDSISGTTDTVRKDSTCVTLSLEKGGDLYKMIYDMFPE